ncbi:MAG: phytoene desaturase family protein [Gammaproteobacteria bacterium]
MSAVDTSMLRGGLGAHAHTSLRVAAHGPRRVAHRADAPHAVVIGSGFGGLAAAVRLGARGYRVTVLERLSTPGGRAAVHQQDGFTFDAGPTIITAPHLFEELWQLAGRSLADDVELKALDPFYEIRFDDGAVFRAGRGDALRAEVARLAPSDLPGFDQLMALSKQIFDIAFLELGHRPFGSLRDMLRVLPRLAQLRGHLSVYQLVARYLKDERLRVAFSFHPLLVGGNPFTTTSVYTLISHLEQHWGVHYAMGGTGRLVAGLAGLIAHQGNTLRCDAEVDEILVHDERAVGVRLAGGERIAADLVVSNADPLWTYSHMLPGRRPRRWNAARIGRARHSMSLFVWYFGTRRRYEDVPHHTILLGPRYRGLLEDIFERHTLADDFSLYLHRPTASDARLAPPGCDAFYVLSPVPHLGADIDWRRAAEPYRQAIARHLEARLLPGLQEEIVTSRITTPLDFEARYLSIQGAAFGLEPRLFQSAWFRPHNASEELGGLYLVGAGTHPGAGLPGVLSSARVLDELVPHADAWRGQHARG